MKQEIYSGLLFACEEANALISSMYSKAAVSYSSMDNETKAQSDSVSLVDRVWYFIYSFWHKSNKLSFVQFEARGSKHTGRTVCIFRKTRLWFFLPSLFIVLVTDSLMIDLQGKSSETGDSHPKQQQRNSKSFEYFSWLSVTSLFSSAFGQRCYES